MSVYDELNKKKEEKNINTSWFVRSATDVCVANQKRFGSDHSFDIVEAIFYFFLRCDKLETTKEVHTTRQSPLLVLADKPMLFCCMC